MVLVFLLWQVFDWNEDCPLLHLDTTHYPFGTSYEVCRLSFFFACLGCA